MDILFGRPMCVHIGKHMVGGHISEHAQFEVTIQEKDGRGSWACSAQRQRAHVQNEGWWTGALLSKLILGSKKDELDCFSDPTGS